MRRIAPIGFLSAMIGLVSAAVPAWADSNPSGTGPPGQSCQNFSATTRPGHSASSPGSPFNEPMVNSQNGGTGRTVLQRQLPVRRRLLPAVATLTVRRDAGKPLTLTIPITGV
jgi:hypothetical protein